jgi:hypothetical protein
VRVEEIHFNHDAATASGDALNIRRNASGQPIRAPEWKFGHMPQPAAYARAALTGTVTIRVRFRGGPPNGVRRVRAIDAYLPPATPGGCLGWFLALIAKIIHALVGNVLGDVKMRAIAFDAAGDSALETFELINHKLTVAAVGARTTEWVWQWRPIRPRLFRRWHEFDRTSHRIYTVIDIPRGPWEQNATFNNLQLPWADALEKSCTWAVGASDANAAADRITRAINTRSNQGYTPTTIFGFSPPYQLTSYMTHLDSGAPFVLNCTDCANAVTTFANLLGCDLWEGRFFNMVTRKFLTLNGNPANAADWVSWSWGYHEICWLASLGVAQPVYDGCLQLDMDNNYSDNVHVAQHPIKMQFGQSAPTDYRYRLIESGTGSPENIPRRRTVA